MHVAIGFALTIAASNCPGLQHADIREIRAIVRFQLQIALQLQEKAISPYQNLNSFPIIINDCNNLTY
ncbi:hypothetical protein [Candidatus Magnetomonas plexicatena]|uniref:hypothetical protein n=1 Tax=Candidatus Magnetomonas plexicatena TaxID=2552947 RepID=UPI004033110D